MLSMWISGGNAVLHFGPGLHKAHDKILVFL